MTIMIYSVQRRLLNKGSFIMPGFLYDYATFSERFQTPIVKLSTEELLELLEN